jgi:hypothetical protein
VWPAFALSAAAAGVMLSTSVDAVAESDDVGERIAQRAAAAYHALPPGEREDTALLAQSYIVAAYLDGYSTRYGLPEAHSGNRGYGWFPPPPETADSALYVGTSADEVRPWFRDVRRVDDGGPDARESSVWLCTGRQEPWAEIWPRLRTLTVG